MIHRIVEVVVFFGLDTESVNIEKSALSGQWDNEKLLFLDKS